jgi:hypothetical protein
MIFAFPQHYVSTCVSACNVVSEMSRIDNPVLLCQAVSEGGARGGGGL